MSIAVAQLNARFTADTSDLERGAQRAQSTLENMTGSFNVVGAAAVAMGSLIASGVSMGIGALVSGFSQATTAGMEFGSTVNRIQALSDATAGEMEAVRQKALELGQALPISAQQAADGIQELVAGGMTLNQALTAVTGTAQLAASQLMPVGDAAAIVSAALNSFGLAADESGRVSDVLTTAANMSAAGVSSLGEALKYAGGIAGATNQSIEGMAAALGLMANAGIQGEMAGTALRAVLSELAAPGKEARAVMQQLGVSITDSAGQMRPFMDIVADMRGAMEGLSNTQRTAIANIIAGTPGMAGFLAVLNATPAAFDGMRTAMDNAAGATDRFGKAMQQGLGYSIEQLKGSIETGFIQAFARIEPILISVADKATAAVNRITKAIASFDAGAGPGTEAILKALGMSDDLADKAGDIVQKVVSTIQNTLSGFQIGGVGGGATALLASLGLNEDAASAVGGIIDGIASAIQTGIAKIQTVLATVSPYFAILSQAIATALPYAIMFADIMGGALAQAMTVLSGVIQFLIANWQIFANVLAIVAAVLAGGAIAAGISALVSGFGLLMGALQGVMIILPMIPGAIVALAGPFGIVAGVVMAFALAWTQNWGNIQGITFEVVARAIATINQLGGAMHAIGYAIEVGLSQGPAAGAAAFQGAMSQVNADYENAVANAAVKGEQMRANADASWAGMVNGAQQWFGNLFSVQDNALNQMIANAKVKMSVLAQIMAAGGNNPGAEAIDANEAAFMQGQRANSGGGSAAAALARIPTPEPTRYIPNLGQFPKALKGTHKAASDTAHAAKSAEDKVREAAQAIQSVAETVKTLKSFLEGGEFEKLQAGEGADKIVQVAANLAALGRRIYQEFVKAAHGLGDEVNKAAVALGQGIQASASALNALTGMLPKLWEFMHSPEWAAMQGSMDDVLAISEILINWGRQLFDVMVAASDGVTEESAKAASSLSQGIGASAQAVQSVVGLLPKLYEFTQSEDFPAIMASQDDLLRVSGILIDWGKRLFEVFAAAAAGVSEEAVKAAGLLSQGIGSSVSAVTAVLELLPKLYEFTQSAYFDDIMANRDELLRVGAILIDWGKALFEIFAAAAAGVSERAVKAAQLLSQGIGAATQALTAIIDLIPKLLNSVWGIDTSFAYTAEGKAVILAASRQLIALGVAIFEAFAQAAAGISAKSVAAAGLLSDGITKSVDALLKLTEYVEKAMNLFYNIGTRQVVSAEGKGEQAVEHISLKLIEIGVNILNNFAIASAGVKRTAFSAANLMGTAMGQAVDALSKMLDYVTKAINTFYNTGTRQVVAADQRGELAVQHISLKLIQMGVNILNNFAQAAGSVKHNALVAAQQMGTAMGQAVDGLLKMMEFATRAIQMLYDTGTRQVISATERGELAVQHIAYKLIQMGVNILNNFQAAANTLHYAAPAAAQVLGAAITQAMDALLKSLDFIERFAQLTDNVVTRAAVLNPDSVTAAAGRLAYFGAAVVNLLWAAGETLHVAAPSGVATASPAITQTFDALLKVLDYITQYATFVSEASRVAAVATALADGGLAQFSGHLALIAATIVNALGGAAQGLDQAALPAIDRFAQAADATFSALGSTMDYITRLIAFLGDQLAYLMVEGPGARQWVINFSTNMTLLVRGLVDAFAGLVPELTELQVTLSGRFTSTAGDVLDMLGAAMEYVSAIPEFLANSTALAMVGGPGGRAWTAQFSGWLTETIQGIIDAFEQAYTVLTEAEQGSIARFTAVGDNVLGSLSGVMDFVERLSDFTHNGPALNMVANPQGTGVAALVHGLTEWAKSVITEVLNALGEWRVVDAGLQTFRDQVERAMGVLSTIVDALDTLDQDIQVPMALTGSDRASGIIRGLVLWAGSVANVAAQAVDELDLLDTAGLEPLGDAMSRTVDVFGGALDAIEALSGLDAADIPLFGDTMDDPTYRLIWRLVTYANLVASTAAQAAIGFQNVNVAGLEPLASAIGDTVGIFSDVLDALSTLTDLDAADVPLFGNAMADPTYRLIWRLVTYASLVSTTAAQAAVGFERVNIEGLSPLASAIGDFLSILGDTLDAMAGLKDLQPPPLPDTALLSVVTAIVQWAKAVADKARQVAAGFALGDAYGLGDLGTAISDFQGVLGGVVDALAGLKDIQTPEPPSNDLLNTIDAIVGWARAVATRAVTAAGAFALGESYGLGDLSTAIGDFMSVLGSVVDGIASLRDAPTPEPPSNDLLNTVDALVRWARAVSEKAITAANSFALGETYGLGDLGTAIGDFLGVLGSVTDAIAALKEAPTPEAPSADILRQVDALTRWALAVADRARQAAAGFALGEAYGLGDLGTAISDFQSVLDGVLGLIPKLTTRADLPNLGDPLSPKSLAGYIGRLSEWAQAVAEIARDAARDFAIAENSGLSQLAGAIGDTLTLLEGGLKLDALESAILNFTGLNRATVGPKIALLIEDVKWIAKQFMEAARNSGISEEMADAAARLAQVFGDAVGAFTSALELGTKLADPETVIPTVTQVKGDLDTLMGLMRDIVARFATEAANTSVDVDKVGAYAETVSKLFDSLGTALDTVKNFEGIYTGWNGDAGSSGVNNIRSFLAQLFGVFGDFAGQGEAINSVTAAIASMLGALANMATAQGSAAGSNWATAFIAAVQAGLTNFTPTVNAPTARGGGGGGGSGPTQIYNDYRKSTTVSAPINISGPAAGQQAAQSIYSLQSLYG